jgi:hypothetical protein
MYLIVESKAINKSNQLPKIHPQEIKSQADLQVDNQETKWFLTETQPKEFRATTNLIIINLKMDSFLETTATPIIDLLISTQLKET